jgi:hypothetical protein
MEASGKLLSSMRGSDTLALALLLVPLIFLNHFEVGVEWSQRTVGGSEVRVGFSAGSGF